jgi:hypothetical protein
MSLAALYISGTAERLVVRDGRSIVVRQHGESWRRYPFNRLSHIVSDHRVNWKTDAITGCMSFGVPVFFSDGRGEYIGACYGTRRRETTLANLLRLSLEHPNGEVRLVEFLHAFDCEARHLCAEKHGLRGRVHESEVVISGATNNIFSIWQVPPGNYLKAYEGLLRSWVETELLESLGHESELIAYPLAGFHLGEKITESCRWSVLSVLANAGLAPLSGEAPSGWAVRVFHINLVDHARTLGKLLGRMEATLRTCVW